MMRIPGQGLLDSIMGMAPALDALIRQGSLVPILRSRTGPQWRLRKLQTALHSSNQAIQRLLKPLRRSQDARIEHAGARDLLRDFRILIFNLVDLGDNL